MVFFEVLVQYFPSFSVALGETVKLTGISLICATVLGVIFGLFKVSGIKPLKLIANIYIDIIRGTPLMVQVMIIFYGLSQVLRLGQYRRQLYSRSSNAESECRRLHGRDYSGRD